MNHIIGMQTIIIALLMWPRVFYSHQRKKKYIIIASTIHYSLYKWVKQKPYPENSYSDEPVVELTGAMGTTAACFEMRMFCMVLQTFISVKSWSSADRGRAALEKGGRIFRSEHPVLPVASRRGQKVDPRFEGWVAAKCSVSRIDSIPSEPSVQAVQWLWDNYAASSAFPPVTIPTENNNLFSRLSGQSSLQSYCGLINFFALLCLGALAFFCHAEVHNFCSKWSYLNSWK